MREEGGEMLGELEGDGDGGERDEDDGFVRREEELLASEDQKRVGMLSGIEKFTEEISELSAPLRGCL